MARISVILPVFNGDKYIKEAVTSILNQSYKDFDLYVIDDGSTDQTVEVLQEFNDCKLKIISNDRNRGLIYTLNKGIDLGSDSEFIARMDADDISLKNRFAEQIDYLDANKKVGLLGSAMKYFSEDGSNTKTKYRPGNHSKILSTFLFYNPLFHPTVMIRNSVLGTTDRYPLQFPKNEDHAFWVDLSVKTNFANLNQVLLKYRRHNSNITNTYVNDINNDFLVNKKLLLRFCNKWNIALSESEMNVLSTISIKDRQILNPDYSPMELIDTLNSIMSKLPSAFDLTYFRNVFFDRCLQYLITGNNLKKTFSLFSKYKYDKSFLLRYAVLGKH
ncbi:glycosyltransferase [Larkinella rosea]|uniref:Glycosyltransferase n=1 Tax=Larkinella rosea TaxID=2025312 RepID=A0A3P1BUJ7_9BACT|nr:glycosyltransferase [Larkinella rosea]RRB04224.1 glycosyltransferase [Larkinella rosea]